MGLVESLTKIAERVPGIKDRLDTEEATKTALIMPFLQALGYDIFDPAEVVPEFTADVGIKRGEKVDYAVLSSGEPIMLFECKPCGAKLNRYSSQLYRYFSVTKSRIAILTDGIEYRFYTDLAAPNILDDRPFMTLDLNDPDETVMRQIEQLSKGRFDLEAVLASAGTMKDATDIRLAVSEMFENPGDDLVRLIADPLYKGPMTRRVVGHFRPLVEAALGDLIAERVEARLRTALQQSKAPPALPHETTDDGKEEKGEADVETTLEELEGFYIVKAVLSTEVAPERIAARDVQTYFGILLDDNNRKPICRLWFNRKQRYLGVFDENRRETRVPIGSAQDIFSHADALRRSLGHVVAE